jgi:hypothetical protein
MVLVLSVADVKCLLMPDTWMPPDNIPALVLGTGLKLNRAQFHLNALKESIDAFFESKPYEIVRAVDPNTNQVFGVLRVKRECPAAWGVLVGDFIHNLRSALDHLVWQLVIHETGNPPPLPLIRSSRVDQVGKEILAL